MLILIVDDDAVQREMLQGFLEKQGFETRIAANGPEAMAIFRREPVELVLLDNRMPGMSGVMVLDEMKKLNPLVHAIMISAFGDINTVVETMKLGAGEFLEKPVDLSLLLGKIREIEQKKNLEQDVSELRKEIEENHLPLKIIAESDAMKEILSLVRRMAGSQWPVLVSGETGTGKELVSRLLHLLSDRSHAPFIDINCAAIPENLFESELFGHLKGAFTGAANDRRGSFEVADSGTLLLDEIGEIPMSLQPKLLRTIQEKKIKKIGSEKDIGIDVRLISATNRDLKQMVESGHFRDDLYYRIKVLELRLPPLRNRRADIPPMLSYFLERYSQGRLSLSPEALNTLIKYPFPGNVRELEHIIQRTVTLARGSVIHFDDLPEEIRHHDVTTHGTLEERLAAVEYEMIKSALEKNNGVQTRAAEMLGISERVLRYKMKKSGLKTQ